MILLAILFHQKPYFIHQLYSEQATKDSKERFLTDLLHFFKVKKSTGNILMTD